MLCWTKILVLDDGTWAACSLWSSKIATRGFDLFFEEEKGFIFRMEDADGEVCPVSSLMKRQVLEDADGAHHIVWPGGEQISVKDLAHFRVLKTLGVKVVPSDVVATLSFAHFQWPRFGFRIWHPRMRTSSWPSP